MLNINTKLQARRVFTIINIALCFFYQGAHAQKKADPSTSELQKQFGDDAKIVCLSSSISYTFEYTTARNAMSPVNATEITDEEFKSMKDDYDWVCGIEYDDYTDIGKIKTFDNKDKRIDAYIYDLPVESNEFSTGDRERAFNLHFENKGDKGGYTGEKYYGDLKYLDGLDLMGSEPILEKEITVTVPKWLNIELKDLNFDGYDIKKSVTTDAKGNTVYSYVAKNLKAINYRESHVPNVASMFPCVIILCKSFTSPDGKTTNIISGVGDMYNWYKKLVAQAGNNDEPLKPVVNDLIKGKTNDIDKVKAIYYWVQDNIRYLAYENGISGNKPDACQNVLQKKYGDCKCMANLLVEMLKIAGFDARRTWLSDDSDPFNYSTMPSLISTNHCICTLILGGKHYYLDCTEKYEPLNDNADRVQGRELIIEDGDKYISETIPVAPIERNKIAVNRTMTVAAGDLLAGDAHMVYNGESKTFLLDYYHNIPSDKRQDVLKMIAERDDANLSASAINTTDLENREVPLKLGYNFKMKNQVSDFDNDTYVNMDYEKVFENLTFDSTRQCDYLFNFRYDDEMNDTLIVPSGYTVKHLPDNVDKTTPNYVFKAKYTQSGNKVIYHAEVEILHEILKKKDFAAWNADLAVLKKTYDDQVVLTKGK